LFTKEAREIIAETGDAGTETDKVSEAVFAEFVSKLDQTDGNEPNMPQYLRKVLAESIKTGLTQSTERITNNAAKTENALTRKTAKFKSEHILYEMSTFEEILHYSVSRLRNAEIDGETDDFIKTYTAVIDAEHNALLRVLKAVGVEIIRPEQRDIFNGREHEALVAESNPEFKKGEIIKVVNNGYRHNGVILVRATVIAAK
jgi:molecular chaperone GrpE (heat shock protein)